MKQIHNQTIKQKYLKLYRRVSKAIQTGRFKTYTNAKKQSLYNRLKRYERRLKSWGIAVASATALFLSPIVATGQTFAEQTGSNNPLSAVSVGNYSTPTFVDIDNDGDFDVFIGEFFGSMTYYKNTGSNSSPTFTAQTGGANPFNSISPGLFLAPTFVDIDNDGDFDAFIGEYTGTVKYYKNTGSKSSPTFTAQTGGTNPLNGVDVGKYASPTFVDIDNDGDFDVFIGEENGTIKYYKNTGSNSSPTFAEESATNPLTGVNVGGKSRPTFVDIDKDGDFDAFIGDYNGTIKYYQNTGTDSSPTLGEQTGANNPLNGVDVGSWASPTFVDIDDDADFDAFTGNSAGAVKFHENTSAVLPVEMTTFSAKVEDNQSTLLEWQTASEKNNEGFEIERSADGVTWETLGFVPGAGTTVESQNYNFTDETPFIDMNYYRLKQMDFDGRFEHSKIVSTKFLKGIRNAGYFYPNPSSSGIVNLDFSTQNNDEIAVSVFNLRGELVIAEIHEIVTGDNLLNFDFSTLDSGVYIIKLGNDVNPVHRKLIIK